MLRVRIFSSSPVTSLQRRQAIERRANRNERCVNENNRTI